mgnify:CR=1 FL=1
MYNFTSIAVSEVIMFLISINTIIIRNKVVLQCDKLIQVVDAACKSPY